MCELTLSEAGIILTDYVSVTIMKENFTVTRIADMPSFVARCFESRPRLKVVLRDPDVRIPIVEQRALSEEIYLLLKDRLNIRTRLSKRIEDDLAYDLHRQLSKVYRALNGSKAHSGVLGSKAMFQYAAMELTPLVKVHMKRDRGIFELQLTDETANGCWTNGEETGMFSMMVSEDVFSTDRLVNKGSPIFTNELSEQFSLRWPQMPKVTFMFLTADEAQNLRSSIEAATKLVDVEEEVEA